MKTISREAIQRMTNSTGIGGIGRGGDGGSVTGGGADLTGYATQTWVDENYLSIAFFRNLFRAYESDGTTEVLPNGEGTTIDNIKAMFGFWTDQYLSALGQNSSGGGGGGGSSTLAGLNDVQLGTLDANDVLTYDGNGHWVNTPKATLLLGYATQSWVTGTALTGYATQSWVGQQGFLTSVAFSNLTSHPTTLSGYGITDAKFGLVSRDVIPITLGSTTQDVLIQHQSLAGYATESWVTGTALSGYATQSWVGQQGFLTSVAFSDLTSHPTTLSGYGITDAYSKTDADGRFLTISFFRSLFRAYNSSSVEVVPNSGDTTTINNIKAMFGFWTDQYLSALGQNSSGGGGGGGSSTLAGLNDVQIGTLSANDVLAYDGSGHWVNTPKAALLSGYATQSWVTGTALSGYATQSWVGQQGFLTSVAFSDLTSHPTTIAGYGITDAKFGLVSRDTIPITLGSTTQDVLIAHQSLSGYATETWVQQQGYLTSVAFSDLTSHPSTLAGYGITDVGFVSGTADTIAIKLGSSTNSVLTAHQSLAGYATETWVQNQGYATQQWVGQQNYINDETMFWGQVPINGVVSGSMESVGSISMSGSITGCTSIRIGDGVILWDSTNNALKVQKNDGTSANFYATGAVSALGANNGSSGSIDTLTITNQILLDNSQNGGRIDTDGGDIYIGTDGNTGYIKVEDICSADGNGKWYIDIDGRGFFSTSCKSPKFLFDNTRYLFLDNGTLKYYDGSTSKTVVLQ